MDPPLIEFLAGAAILLLIVFAARRRRLRRAAVASPPTQEAMSLQEARALLGVEAGASAGAIRAAYARLMQRAHPDHGGTSGLAAQLTAARERLERSGRA